MQVCDATRCFPGDGICDDPCNNERCNYDGGDCDKPLSTDEPADPSCICACSAEQLDNRICDEACNSLQCMYDGGDCTASPTKLTTSTDNPSTDNPSTKASCPLEFNCPTNAENGICDPDCYSDICGNDGGDCDEIKKACQKAAPACTNEKFGNGMCEEECNYEVCSFDLSACSGHPATWVCKLERITTSPTTFTPTTAPWNLERPTSEISISFAVDDIGCYSSEFVTISCLWSWSSFLNEKCFYLRFLIHLAIYFSTDA